MFKRRKIFFRILSVSVGVWLAIVIAYKCLPVYAADSNTEGYVEGTFLVSYIVICFGIFLVPLFSIKSKDSRKAIALKISGALTIAIVAITLLLALTVSSMCAWSTDLVLFKSKKDPSVAILARSYDCGDADDSTNINKVLQARSITPYFMWLSETDTNKIDTLTWLRVDNSDL